MNETTSISAGAATSAAARPRRDRLLFADTNVLGGGDIRSSAAILVGAQLVLSFEVGCQR